MKKKYLLIGCFFAFSKVCFCSADAERMVYIPLTLEADLEMYMQARIYAGYSIENIIMELEQDGYLKAKFNNFRLETFVRLYSKLQKNEGLDMLAQSGNRAEKRSIKDIGPVVENGVLMKRARSGDDMDSAAKILTYLHNGASTEDKSATIVEVTDVEEGVSVSDSDVSVVDKAEYILSNLLTDKYKIDILKTIFDVQINSRGKNVDEVCKFIKRKRDPTFSQFKKLSLDNLKQLCAYWKIG